MAITGWLPSLSTFLECATCGAIDGQSLDAGGLIAGAAAAVGTALFAGAGIGTRRGDSPLDRSRFGPEGQPGGIDNLRRVLEENRRAKEEVSWRTGARYIDEHNKPFRPGNPPPPNDGMVYDVMSESHVTVSPGGIPEPRESSGRATFYDEPPE